MAVDPLLLDLPDVLRGERVVLRPYRREDAPAVWDAVDESREHLQPWLPWVHEYTSPGVATAFVARAQALWLLRENLVLGIFLAADGRLLGGTGFHAPDWRLPAFTLGYWIRRTAEGQGYVGEAVRLQMHLAFDVLKARRVEVRVDPRNARSNRVMARLGVPLEGTLRRCAPGDRAGEPPTDRHVYAMTEEDYASRTWP